MSRIDLNDIDKRYERGLDKRLTIKGKTETHHSYKIPIDILYYNDLNGRIATYIQEYNETHDSPISALQIDREQYNSQIAEYIIASANDDGASFKKTKEDIKDKGQQIPGVILTDGRIIDGNRRFTALTQLYQETGNTAFSYFEAAVIEAPNVDDKDGWRSIKTLELNLQFNVDDKRDYDRIDELVSFYRDVLDSTNPNRLDEKAYSYASGKKTSQLNTMKQIVRIMLDYLNWRNKPCAFYILKNEKLDGPLEEIARYTKRMSEQEWNKIKDSVYCFMSVSKGDRTRDIRKLLESAKNNSPIFTKISDAYHEPTFLNDFDEYLRLKDEPSKTPEGTTRKKQLNDKLAEKLDRAYADGVYSENIQSSKSLPEQQVSKAIQDISSIDLLSLKLLDQDEKNKIIELIDTLQKKIKDINDACQ